MLESTAVTVQVRHKNLTIAGTIDNDDLQLSARVQWANIGSWSVSLPVEHPLANDLAAPGAGIVLKLHGNTIASGPSLAPEFAQTFDDPDGTITVSGVWDNVLLADHLAYPDPDNLPGAQTTAWDKRTGSCESLIHAYVNKNIGPGALAGRQVADLVMGTNGDRGRTTTRKPRFNCLGTLVAGLARAGRLGFEIVQVGTTREFRTYAVRDRTAEVVLDVRDDSLSRSAQTISAPTATNVIVGGRGHGKHRKFRDASTTESESLSDAWGRRVEVYMDYRGGDDTPEAADLEASGAEFLDDELDELEQIELSPSAYTDNVYGVDWKLGDRITVMVGGEARTIRATGLVLVSDENGLRYGVSCGDPVMSGGGRAGAGSRIAKGTPKPGKPGKPHRMGKVDDNLDDLMLEVPDLTERTLDGLDYVVENRVLLLEAGQTVGEWQALHPDVEVPIGTLIFEKA